jgi:hypothetical protein
MEQKQKDTFMGCLVILGIIGGLSMVMQTCGEKKEKAIVESSYQRPVTKPSLFGSSAEFRRDFNSYCSKAGLDLNILDLKFTDGEVSNSFIYSFSDNLAISGITNKSDGSVTELFMIGRGNGSLESGTDIILCMVAIIATVDPSIPAENRAKVLRDLHCYGDDSYDITNMSTNTEINGFKYYVNSSEQMGLMFGVTKASDI